MSKYLQKHLKLHKISKKWLWVFALVVIGAAAIGGFSFAKYYANNSNKGVTAAANYYFSSNVLSEALTEGDEEWKTVFNTDSWDGNSQFPFVLKIQNYQNQLLYNSENLNIEYSITFELLEDDGGSYAVCHGTEESKALTVGNPVTYENLVIKGGMARSDEFKVFFTAPSGVDEEYRSPGIRVVAEITGPDFLAKTKTQIGGILRVGIVKAEYSLNGAYDFSFSTMADNWSEEDRKTITAMAAFPYSITYKPGEDNVAHQIQVSWNASKLQLNQFDENYSNVVTDTTTNQSTLQLYIQPNETKQLIFYRTEEFDIETISPAEFQGLISITDLDKTE